MVESRRCGERGLAILVRVLLILVSFAVFSGPVEAQSKSPEIVFWESVRNTGDPAELEAYLKAFPNGKFAPLARIRLNRLKTDPGPKTEVGTKPDKDAEPTFRRTAERDDKVTVPDLVERAGKGDAQSLFRLGTLYLDGNGVPKSEKRAIAYFCLARDFGSRAAVDRLTEKAKSMGPILDLPKDSPFADFFKEYLAKRSEERTAVDLTRAVTALCRSVDAAGLAIGEKPRAWLGVRIQRVSEEIARSMGLAEESGALVLAITSGSPAEKAGLRSGDVILKWEGIEVPNERALPYLVSATPIGKRANALIFRAGKMISLAVTVERLPARFSSVVSPDTTTASEGNIAKMGGVTVLALTERSRAAHGITDNRNGLLIAKIAPGSDAAKKGLRIGDVISEVATVRMTTPEQFVTKVEALRREGRTTALLLILDSSGKKRFVAMPISEADLRLGKPVPDPDPGLKELEELDKLE